MALGAVLAAALTDHSARSFMLTIAGMDVIKSPAGNGFGTPIETIRLERRGAGMVSTLDFVLDDPAGTFTPLGGEEVIFRNITADVIEFHGVLASMAPEAWQPSGKRMAIRCLGAETVLDWAKMAALTIPAGTRIDTAIQSCVANVVNGLALPLNALSQDAFSSQGSQARPVGDLYNATIDPTTALAIAVGTTLREAIRICVDDIQSAPFTGGSTTGGIVTVDTTLGLRVFPDRNPADLSLDNRGDPITLTVNDTAGPKYSANTKSSQDYANMPSAVLVIGAGVSVVVAGFGTGDCVTLSDTTLNTTARAISAGRSMMARYASQARIEFDLEAVNTTGLTQLMPGDQVNWTNSLTVPQGGDVHSNYRLTELHKTYYAGGTKENWHVILGAGALSISTALRRLTRSTLS